MTSIRFRGDKNILDIAKNLDAFSKVPEEYTETTKIGGILSLISRIIIIFLIYKEVTYFQNSNVLFTFYPDVNLDTRVRMTVDITIAMPCIGLSGVDLIDDTKQDVFTHGILKRENTWWELDENQREYFNEMQHVNSYLREEYHSITNLLFKNILVIDKYIDSELPKREIIPKKPHDACRLYGTFMINKVAGVLHFVSGDTLSFEIVDNHWHINEMQRTPLNFTHRINMFSFGELAGRLVQPLEGDEKNVPGEKSVMQYFIEVVPTEVHNMFSKFETYQYSVKENLRNLNSNKNSYGLPGIYFKYDWSALKVVVKSELNDGFFDVIQFLIRLCSIISGIIVISGVLNSIIQSIHRSIVHVLAPFLFTETEHNIAKRIIGDQKNVQPPKAPSINVLLTNNLIVDESLPILVNK